MKWIIRRYELTDAEWKRLQPYFPERQMGDKGRPRREAREMLNGIFWIARSGAAWRDLPERYGPWQTVYKRFKEWSENGLIEKIFHELGEEADLQDISIDSTYIKAHKGSSSSSRSSAESPFAMTSSLPASLLSSISPASVSCLHNPSGYAFGNML